MEIPSTYDSSTLESRTLRQWGSGSAPRQNPNLLASFRRSAWATSWGRQYSKKLGSRLHASCPHPPLDVESWYVSCASVTWLRSMPSRPATRKPAASSSRYNTAPSATRSKYQFHRKLDFPVRGGRRIKRTGAADRRSVLIEKRAIGEG
jgi:hypothetical protein